MSAKKDIYDVTGHPVPFDISCTIENITRLINHISFGKVLGDGNDRSRFTRVFVDFRINHVILISIKKKSVDFDDDVVKRLFDSGITFAFRYADRNFRNERKHRANNRQQQK